MSAVESKIQTLIARRNALELSQRDLDKMIGVSECMVAKWEAGHRSPTAESLERWAAALSLRLELVPAGTKKRKKVT